MEPAVAGDTRGAGLESLRPARSTASRRTGNRRSTASRLRTDRRLRALRGATARRRRPRRWRSPRWCSGSSGIPCCTVFALGIAAVVTGFLARKQIAESQGFLKGDGMAMAGLVLGGTSIVVAVVVWILNLTGATDSSFYFDTNA